MARSRDKEKQKLLEKRVDQGRKFIFELFKDNAAFRNEFLLSVQHSVDLIHHIKSENGALSWKNRFKLIESDQNLIDCMNSSDFLCFQECSSPDDLNKLLSIKFKTIEHNVRSGSQDNCLLCYDSEKYELIEEPTKISFESKKPAIFALLQSKKTKEKLIVGSVHLPGISQKDPKKEEKKSHNLNFINKNLEDLLKIAPGAKYFVAGDYNGDQNFYQQDNLYYPQKGTMAGSDYGSLNKSIDAIMSQESPESINVQNIEIASAHPNALLYNPAPKVLHRDYVVKPRLAGEMSYGNKLLILSSNKTPSLETRNNPRMNRIEL